MTETSTQRGFSSSFGAIMAAVGSAVGLGNIWRFPYITGKYGGGAFLLVYLAFVFLIGMVLMMSEFIIGRRSQHTPTKAFPTLCPSHKGWRYLGLFCMITCFTIVSQYVVVSGWTVNYIWDSATGALSHLNTAQLETHFTEFSTGTMRPLLFMVLFIAINAVIILGGVQKGIEAVTKILMPFLVLLLLVLCVRSLTLSGAQEGLNYMFRPDFSKLTGEGVLAALGQALFSLSVGMGAMVVYGSYIPLSDNIFKTSRWITTCDTLIAVLAGVAIFPAVFHCGMEPAGGPGLVFKVLPAVFNSMGSFGIVFSVLFFLLLAVAALTSSKSLFETLVAWVVEALGVKRAKATLGFSVAVMCVGAMCALSYGMLHNIQIAKLPILDFVDRINSIYLPPLCAIGTIIFLGWQLPKEQLIDELSNHGTIKIGYFRVYYFLARYIAPTALIVVLLGGILML